MSAPGHISALGRFVGRNRASFPVRKLAGLCRRYVRWFENLNYDPLTNGERFVVETLGRFKPAVIVDGGANVGDWSVMAAAACPTARIHAFEISPPTFAALVEHTAALPAVTPVPKGLSDTPGTIEIRHYDGLSVLTTATAYPHPAPYTVMPAEVTSIDAYVAAEGLAHIDLLKIDVEGMEEKVLRGCADLLARGAVDLIQFEYGMVNIMFHSLLYDFHNLLEGHGFAVGKIFPDHVRFKPYDFPDEDFLGPNYLACRRDRADLLAALSK